MRHWLVLLLCVAGPFAHAAEGVWLLFDSTIHRPLGALSNMPYQHQYADGKSRRWIDPERWGGMVVVPILTGGAPLMMMHDPVPGWRIESMLPITVPMDRNAVLRLRLEETTRTVLAAHGLSARIFADTDGANEGHLPRLGDRGGEPALVIQRDGAPIVQLSWDDRQLLLAAKFRRYEPSRTPAKPERERGLRRVRYIGAPLPGDAPMQQWSADDAALFLARVDQAWARLLGEALLPPPDVPKVARGETVQLRIGGQDMTFAGRLLKQEDGFAHVATRDSAISLVELAD